jgi:hypothetical protein
VKAKKMEKKSFFLRLRPLADVFYVLFALVLLLIVVASFYFIGRSFFGTRHISNVVYVEENAGGASDPAVQWGVWQNVPGASCLLLPIEAKQKYDENYYNKSATSVRNLLFLVPGKSQHWLFPHHEQLLLNQTLITERLDASFHVQETETKAIFYQIVRQDTNKDGKWTANDEKILAFSTPCGERFVEVLTVEKFFGWHSYDNNFLLFYQRQGIAQTALIDKDTFALLREEPLPALP